jgi:anti-sigma factor RsiW
MRWQCALLQRWLPEYPDGELPAWGKRWFKSHMASCPACRQELAGLRKVVAAIEATPVPDPAAEFWGEFSRDMHLKLVQAAQGGVAAPVSASPRRFRLSYLLGAPALAVLLVWVAVQLTGPGNPVPEQALIERQEAAKLAAVPQRAPAPPTGVVAAPAPGMEQFATVALEEGVALPVEEVDISGMDLDSELAGMTDQEKERFLKKLHQHEKDGSWVEGFSFCSWA